MVEENKKIVPDEDSQKKPAEMRTTHPQRKPDFDEEKLRREVHSIPLQRLREKYPESIEDASFYAGETIIRVKRERFIDVCSFLKEAPDIDMNYLSCITGVDYPEREKRFDLVYHLYSISKNHTLTLKVSVGLNESTPSVTGIWKTANWHEREAYDLLGIIFSDHPNLERILAPEDFDGHPLRKDFPVEGKPEAHVRYR